jgi:hypothetical protein
MPKAFQTMFYIVSRTILLMMMIYFFGWHATVLDSIVCAGASDQSPALQSTCQLVGQRMGALKDTTSITLEP